MQEICEEWRTPRLKTTETLLGIETWSADTLATPCYGGLKTTETLLGIETRDRLYSLEAKS